MKKTIFSTLLIVVLATTLLFASCKKDNGSANSTGDGETKKDTASEKTVGENESTTSKSTTTESKQDNKDIKLAEDEILYVNGYTCPKGVGRFILNDLERIYGESFDWEQDINGLKAYGAVKKEVFDILLQFYTLKAFAADNDIKISDENEKKIEEILNEYLKLYTDDYLKEESITKDDLKNIINMSFLAEAVKKQQTKDFKINQDKLEEYLMKDAAYALAKELDAKKALQKVKVQHILLSTQDETGQDKSEDEKQAAMKKAEELKKKVEDGENITQLVEKYSEDPSKVQNKGIYTFNRAGLFVKEFKDAGFDMKKGETRIVKTQFGYHVIHKLDVEEATEEELKAEEARIEALREQFTMHQIDEEFKKIYKEKILPKYSEVTKINDKLWDSMKTNYERSKEEIESTTTGEKNTQKEQEQTTTKNK